MASLQTKLQTQQAFLPPANEESPLTDNDDNTCDNYFPKDNDDNEGPETFQDDPQAVKKQLEFTKNTFNACALKFKDCFTKYVFSTKMPQGLLPSKEGSSNVQLKIKPHLDYSWLKPSHTQNDSDKVAFWPVSTKFPSSTILYPANFPFRPPKRPRDLAFESPRLGRLLLHGPIKEARLDPTVFSQTDHSIKSAAPQVATDSFVRAGMLDSLLSSELIQLLRSLLCEGGGAGSVSACSGG